jgi:rhamnosyltransferase
LAESFYPKVAVLLAAFNGEKWITEQIESILAQVGVAVDIYVNIDLSDDNTYPIVKNIAKGRENIYVLPYGERFGSAEKNFFHMVRDVKLNDYGFVAFADQDDVWLPQKLLQGIHDINRESVSAYSSDVVAFWANGKQKLVKKSYPQTLLDYRFESAGPGCTYIMRSIPFRAFQDFVTLNWDQIIKIEAHDWLVYAFFRTQGFDWFISSKALTFYRQHETNQFGANASFSGYLKRWRLAQNGWYWKQVEYIGDILSLPRISFTTFMLQIWQVRRNPFHRVILLFFALFMN